MAWDGLAVQLEVAVNLSSERGADGRQVHVVGNGRREELAELAKKLAERAPLDDEPHLGMRRRLGAAAQVEIESEV